MKAATLLFTSTWAAGLSQHCLSSMRLHPRCAPALIDFGIVYILLALLEAAQVLRSILSPYALMGCTYAGCCFSQIHVPACIQSWGIREGSDRLCTRSHGGDLPCNSRGHTGDCRGPSPPLQCSGCTATCDSHCQAQGLVVPYCDPCTEPSGLFCPAHDMHGCITGVQQSSAAAPVEHACSPWV